MKKVKNSSCWYLPSTIQTTEEPCKYHLRVLLVTLWLSQYPEDSRQWWCLFATSVLKSSDMEQLGLGRVDSIPCDLMPNSPWTPPAIYCSFNHLLLLQRARIYPQPAAGTWWGAPGKTYTEGNCLTSRLLNPVSQSHSSTCPQTALYSNRKVSAKSSGSIQWVQKAASLLTLQISPGVLILHFC